MISFEQFMIIFENVKDMLVYRCKKVDKLLNYSDVELNEMLDMKKSVELMVNKDTLLCIYLESYTDNINNLKRFTEDKGVTNMIIVVEFDLKSERKMENEKRKIYEALQSQQKFSMTEKMNIEVFGLNEFLYNISKHMMVPKHEILGEDEKIRLKIKYGLKDYSKFLIILKTDAMAKYINSKEGDLVKITRYSKSIGESIAYRYCI